MQAEQEEAKKLEERALVEEGDLVRGGYGCGRKGGENGRCYGQERNRMISYFLEG